MTLRGRAAGRSSRLRGGPGRAAASGRAASFLLGALVLLGTSEPVLAQTREELRAAINRLRQVEASLEPLPDTGITRDVGQIAIVEHDDSNYNARLDDGTLNYEARTRVGQRFYEAHADAYDFLVVFTNFSFKTSDATAFHLFGRNDVKGIGKPVGSAGDLVFGSPARLKGWIDMADVSQYRERPFSLTPGDLGFLQTLNVLAHEVGHQWLAEAKYKEGELERTDLLGADGNHWSYLLDSDASLFYGADWRDNGDGTFTAAHVKERYSALDLYLMGLLPREKVPPLRLLRNPAVDTTRINREGEVVTATGTTEVLVDQLIAAMGPRIPDWRHSQKEFRLGFVFLTKPGTEPSEEDLAAVERVRRAFGAHFFALTHGVAWADTTLVETPSPPLAAAPDLQKALAWLAAQQGLDGSWADAAETRPRDTAAAVWALAAAGASGPAWSRGVAWLQQAQPESLDFRARLASALAPRALTAADRAARAATLFSSQNADGGFGAGTDFASDALDTALALRALKALDQVEDARVRLAVNALAGLANPDGGWPAVAGGETSTVATAEVLLALLDWSETPGSAALRGTGLAALLTRRNGDGGFGSSPSTPHATALALEVLLRSGAPADVVGPVTAWLEANQLADGSWAGSPYQTALVLAALRQSLGPNLVVPAATLALSPNPAQEGEVVHVTARVRNAGRETAPATVAHLFDDDPASSPARGEAAVPALAPGEEAEVTFDYPTQDRAGTRALSVVADAAGSVRESREDDNTASLALTVVGKLADLVVRPTDIVVSPVGPEVGESVTIAVTVRNAGERASSSCNLRATVATPSGEETTLTDSALPGLAPGESATLSFGWSPQIAGRHVVHAVADIRFAVPESDESNNHAAGPVDVVWSVPEEPGLGLRTAEVEPSALEELPQALLARVVVTNAGRTDAGTTVAVYDPGAGDTMIGSADVEVAARSARTVTVPLTIGTPGERTLRLVIDPENVFPEEDEDDNLATVRLGDARTFDLELAAADLSAAEVEVGQPVSATVEIRNRGTRQVLRAPVQLGRLGPDGILGLARTEIDIPAGQTRVLALSWTPTVPEDAVPLVARVDPFDLLAERNEENNAVSLQLRVRPPVLPNLSVSGADIAFAPDPPAEGQTATVSVLVRNTGAAAAGPFMVRFFVGDPDEQGAPIGEATLGAFDPGQTATAVVTWAPVDARGSLGLFALADALDQVEEANEDDNRAFRPFQAIGLPDLVLTASDTSFEPAYPRAGEAVTIRARVLNLGGQASRETTLAVREGEPGTPIGVLPVPALAPGAEETLSLSWTPGSPPGERRVFFQVDPEGLVAEQDEGNNSVRRTVVAQDADLYLTEPYFSPNGDGVKDETTLAWRAAEGASVVVSNSRGQEVRTLLDGAPAPGSVTWDGRDRRGVVALDGHYTLTLAAADGRRIGAAAVVLDTNRSPLHDVTRPASLATRNLTCALPQVGETLVWLPGEDGLLLIHRQATEDFPVGLLRLDLDGSTSYVEIDDWYRNAYIVSGRAVSPDGQEVLVAAEGQLFAVALATGTRRPLGQAGAAYYYWSGARWSPDGRWILAEGKVLSRDGTEVADLEALGFGNYARPWDWSPDSTRLALGDLIVSRDGSVLHASALAERGEIGATYWRGDGRIVASLVECNDGCSLIGWMVIDPDTGAATDLGWDPGWNPAWSPDGSRVIASGRLYDAAGKLLGVPLPASAEVSPYSGAALVWVWKGNTDDPLSGQICGDKYADMFVVSNLANLTADLRPTRLPANNGLLLYGTVGDRNLDHYQLDYARRDEPGVWHPIGAALDTPAVDDQLGVWAPDAPGTYFIRLSAVDRAGNRRVRTRAVAWDRVPALANFSQSGFFLSPGGNGVKEVRLDYFVVEPTRVEIRVRGPEPASPSAPPARQVFTTSREYGTVGAQSFVWTGRDDSNAVVPDGRYTLFLNDLPFRVHVDSSPPEIDYRIDDPHVVGGVSYGGRVCTTFRRESDPDQVPLGAVLGWEARYAVDPNLKAWRLASDALVVNGDSEPIYEPVIGPDGLPVLDQGVPRVRREGGRPVSQRRESSFSLPAPDLRFEAEDLAGNRSAVAVPSLREGLWALGAAARCLPILKPPVLAEKDATDPTKPPVNALAPRDLVLLAGGHLGGAPDEQNVRFSFEPKEGGVRRELPMTGWYLPIRDFSELADPAATYRGRFVGNGEAGEVTGDDFLFSPCPEWLVTKLETIDKIVYVVLRSQTREPLARAWLFVTRGKAPRERVEMLPLGDGVFLAPLPPPGCLGLKYRVEAQTTGGRTLPEAGAPLECSRVSDELWDPCQDSLSIRQVFEGCAGSPDRLALRVSGYAPAGSLVEVERGPTDAPIPVGTYLVPFTFGAPFSTTMVADVRGEPEGGMPVRARIIPPNAEPDEVSASAEIVAVIDRTPPTGEVLLPPEGGLACASPETGDTISFQALANDGRSPEIEMHARARPVGGAWSELARVCGEGDAACLEDPAKILPRRPVVIGWNAAAFPAGDYQSETTFCDQSGNATLVPRSFTLMRQPRPRIVSVSRRLISPNGDGRSEETVVTVRLAQAGVLAARVRRGTEGGVVVRDLGEQFQTASDIAITWDGRGDGGQPLPDGFYFVDFAVTDACGGTGSVATPVEIDTVPPDVGISDPTAGQRLSAGVDVMGQATDAHFGTWTLDCECAGGPWSLLDARGFPVPAGGFLARWDTSRAPPGECQLRLAAEDLAGNRSPEATVAVQVERGDLILRLGVSPDIFSPNGDGRRETTTVEYGLQRRARVRLQVRDRQGSALRTFEDGAVHDAGERALVWDGRDDTGEPTLEGDHLLWIRAEDPDAPSVYEEKTTRLVLDRTPPGIVITRPSTGSFVSPRTAVQGSITDVHLAEYTITVASAGGSPVEIARAVEERTSVDLASLPELPEGSAALQVVATDLAENTRRLDVPFVVDSIPPLARIQSPPESAFLRRGETPIPVTGLATDDHLESWALRFGAGAEPAAFVAIAQGETGGDGIALGAWDVRFVPDGVYTLSLVATDRAGLSTEARVTVTLDSVPPTVAISSPVAGGYVTKPGPIMGTAADLNLASWELESAPGEASAAYQWSPLHSGTASVTDRGLADWSPLPPDGVYTLRLTARDKVDLSASTKTTVTVDTTPPAMPTGLAAKVTKAREGYGLVVVTWNPNTEPDLAGYRIERPRETWSDGLLGSPVWDDGERVEGRYAYRVLAEDKAGNQSPAATLQVLVDLTPPLVSFSFPAEDASVAGAVDVRGTAWSADDFAEYRLFVRADAEPSWTLLRRSSVPVAAGTLGEWLALEDGPHVLALEGEDTTGNEARVTRRVVVDTLPPEPPVLIAVAKESPPADWLVPSWQPSPSDDVIGTLVYRNGRLANATSVVLGDRKGFLVPGTSYQDEKLPDGEHCYRVVAMDAAGNESVPSNEICQSLDNRAPAAVIVHPPDGTRFSYPVRVVAETPDLDVAIVRFERRAAGTADWVAFGEVSAPPWETTLDPHPAGGEELAAGSHELRAVATDRTGNTDPAPASITVVYGDTTGPLAPTGLVARVDGADVTLTWTPVEAPDLASYSLYRDGQRIAEGLAEPRHIDPGLAPGTYEYVVTAVDGEANESAPSAPAQAVVYQVSLEPPAWPVLSSSVGSVKGDGSRAETTVTILRENAGIAQGEGTGGAFTVDGVPLVPDGNVLKARGEDDAGNRSVVSNEIVLISNAAPGAVTGLEATVDDRTVSLQWAAVADADLAGYVVHRDGGQQTRTVAQEEAASITATSGYWQAAAQAFDGNPATAWRPYSPGTGTWTVTFPAPVLVEQVRLRFAQPEGTNPGTAADYTVLARWQDRDLPIVRVRGNAELAVEHRLPAPFLTSALSVVLDSPGGLAEVTVERLDVVPPEAQSFEQQGVPDGRHTYEVAAIDRYGAVGEAGAVPVAVGDVDPPSRPTGLVATPIERDVHLTWNPNPEPDIAHYVVFRDGERIGTTSTPNWVDPGLENGTYRYTVTAVDAAGLESEESDPADATIDIQPGPLAAPVILEPTDAANPITLAASVTDVAGRADPGSSVALEVEGEPRGAALAGPGFRPSERVVLPSGYDVAVSPDGKWAAWWAQAGSISLQDLDTGEIRIVPHGGDGWASHFVFSPDGSRLAFTRTQATSPYARDLAVLRLADVSVSALAAGNPVDYAWESGGALLAVSFSETDGSSLSVIDVATGQRTERDRSSGTDRHLRWSPDGNSLAFIRTWWGVASELRVLHFPSDRTRVFDAEPWPGAPPSWSPDGRRLAWTTTGDQPLRVRVQDVEGGQSSDIVDAGSNVVDARFSPDGRWLSYVRLTPVDEWTTLRSVHAIHQEQGLRVTVSEPQEAWGIPDAHEWFGETLAVRAYEQMDFYASEAGRFVVRDVALAPGENRLVARASDPATGRTSPDSETVLVTVPEEAFPDLAVVSGGIVSLPPVPLAAEAAQLRVRVENRGEVDAGETDVRVRVVSPAGEGVLDTRATLTAVASGDESSILLSWTPAVAGTHTVLVDIDPDGLVAEVSETNNAAEREVIVVAEEGLGAEVASDRASYPALSMAHVTVRVANAGTPFSGTARTTVEDASGAEVALLDERPVSLEWGKSVSYAIDWSTGTTPAGPYAFRVRVRATGETQPAATAERLFAIEPGLSLLARVLPQPLVVTEGSPASLVLGVENRSTNTVLDGATARLRLRLEGSSGPATFETVRTLPSIPAGGTWGATDVWAAARPAGRYTVLFEVAKADVVLASASAVLTVAPSAPLVKGTVTVEPDHVLSGATAQALLNLQNQGTAAVTGYPLAVELVAGPEATVHLSVPATVDLAAGESRSLTVSLPTAGVAPGPYVVRLRGGASPVTLDRSRLVVHGLIAPPSPHAPAEGERVATAHPPLVVNNASSPEGAALTYEFALFGDEALTQELPGTTGVMETTSRTAWTVAAGLAEDTTYWWRARATDAFSTSAWSAVASFTVDAVNRPPTAPVPDTPLPGARIASRQPALVVRNAQDPERQALTYEFRLATDEAMSQVVAGAAGLTEGLGLTAWAVTTILEEDAVYYWSARAKTAGDAPEDFSPWSVPVSFQVDSLNGSPTAPTPLRPIGGAEVTTHAPTLVVQNATDPEGDPLTYRFEIDVRPDLGSAERQASEELGEGPGETPWTPPVELREDTTYYWRAHASDGRSATPSVLASFFVDAANEAPGAPVLLDPVDGRTVGTATPTLRLRNAVDPEGDPLTYEIEVRDASDAVVAGPAGIAPGAGETAWTVTTPLAEDQDFTWTARASDGELFGPWSAPAAFRVDAVAEPPTAPVPILPADGAVVEERRPSLVVENATSPGGLPLTYTFEIENASGTLVERAEGIAEGTDTTAWTPSADLADGSYQWRARASDPQQDGPWSSTSRFDVLVDPPPAPPVRLTAVAGDARVRLDWEASPEPDVTGYRVYRSTTAGGPYAFVAAAATNGHDDLGLTNGVTYYYVVTALDARAESDYSNEAAARPEAPQALVAEVRYDPAVIRGECLLPGGGGHRRHHALDPADQPWARAERRASADREGDGVETSCHPSDCPDWLRATLELPAGHDPASIDVESLRLFGSVPADPSYARVVDVDRDGLPELQVRFRFGALAPHLSIGVNLATVVGRAGGSELQGTGTIEVLALATDLWVTPRTLQRRSCGEDVQARVTFAEGLYASKVSVSSVRLNGVVPVKRVVHAHRRELVVKFDRAAVIGVLPLGDKVEVRVTGTLQGLPFVGVDHIRVIE
jgi:subtilase family serine protease